MTSIDRYIMRTTLGAFALVLVSLTAVIWIVHVLRDFDIVTNQGQTVLTFIGISSLLIPLLVMIIAPIASMIAMMYTLNKLNADSEIIVMNASGMSPWRIFKPFAVVGLIVALLVGSISVYFGPKSLRELRTQLTRVRTDLISNILQPGRFTSMDGGALTFHIRERRANGELINIFIDDRRDPTERATFLAERGFVQENEGGTFLLLEHGSAQRQQAKEPDPTIVQFERYAFDLTQFSGSGVTPIFNVTERYIWDLPNPDPDDPYFRQHPHRFRTEFHDRLVVPLYPLAFAVLTFAILGAPRTSRQSRSMSMVMTLLMVLSLRLTGFYSVVSAARTPAMVGLMYAAFVVVFGGGLFIIWRGVIIEPPATVLNTFNTLQVWLASRRLAASKA